jgi:hypothetical protein
LWRAVNSGVSVWLIHLGIILGQCIGPRFLVQDHEQDLGFDMARASAYFWALE